jgi:hypothetical protein
MPKLHNGLQVDQGVHNSHLYINTQDYHLEYLDVLH